MKKNQKYRSFSSYLRDKYGQKVRKISLQTPFSCPNRDGTKGKGGCLYCNEKGSGTGSNLPLSEQISTQISKYERQGVNRFFVYFQSFSNTYGTEECLGSLYDQALIDKRIVGLVIGTRPDCVDEKKIALISRYTQNYEVWIEYGLQSIHERTLQKINRGHTLREFEKALELTQGQGINLCVHAIAGLPGESRENILDTFRYISKLPVQAVKIHSLYIEQGTLLEKLYKSEPFSLMSMNEYVELVADILELLPPDLIIQRLTGECPADRLVAPSWAAQKLRVLNAIDRELRERMSHQGVNI